MGLALSPPAVPPPAQGEIVSWARAVVDRSSSLPDGSTLTLLPTRSIGRLTVIRFEERRHGVPVVARGASVVFDDGRPLQVSTAFAGALPDPVPRIDLAAAARAAGDDFEWDLARAHLAYDETIGSPRLTFRLAAIVPEGMPTRPVAVVDAHDGRLVLRFDAARSAGETLAHRNNPIATPALERVALPAWIAGSTTLDGAAVLARSCVDRGTLRRIGGAEVHVCDVEPSAKADAELNFLVASPADPAAFSPFSETQAYFHAAKAARFFEVDLGLDPKTVPSPLRVVASARWPPGFVEGRADRLGCASCPLDPMSNAFFAPYDPAAPSPAAAFFGVDADAIYLGLGAKRSFAVDGDVVTHEWAHAVVHHTIGLISTPKVDEQGVSFAPATANEALADFFASVLAGDPRIGEWAAGEGAGGEGSLRTLEGEARCPAALTGDVHVDSAILSQALVRVRKQFPIERAVLSALVAAPSGDLSFESLAELLVRAPLIDPAAASTLKTELTARGLLAKCARVLELPSDAPLRAPRGFVAPGRRTVAVSARVPPVVQFRRALPERATRATISLRVRTTAVLRAVVRIGSTIAYDPVGVHVPGGEPVIDVPLVASGEYLRGTFDVPEGRGGFPLHLAVESDDASDARYDEVSVAVVTSTEESPRGCGCGIVETDDHSAVLGALGLVAALARRRKSHG